MDKQEITTDVGLRIAQYRKAKGLTQTDLGKILGLRQPLVACYETGRLRVPVRLLAPCADALGVSVDILLGIREAKRHKPGPQSVLERQLEAVRQLPRSEQQYVSKFLEQVLNSRSTAVTEAGGD